MEAGTCSSWRRMSSRSSTVITLRELGWVASGGFFWGECNGTGLSGFQTQSSATRFSAACSLPTLMHHRTQPSVLHSCLHTHTTHTHTHTPAPPVWDVELLQHPLRHVHVDIDEALAHTTHVKHRLCGGLWARSEGGSASMRGGCGTARCSFATANCTTAAFPRAPLVAQQQHKQLQQRNNNSRAQGNAPIKSSSAAAPLALAARASSPQSREIRGDW